MPHEGILNCSLTWGDTRGEDTAQGRGGHMNLVWLGGLAALQGSSLYHIKACRSSWQGSPGAAHAMLADECTMDCTESKT